MRSGLLHRVTLRMTDHLLNWWSWNVARRTLGSHGTLLVEKFLLLLRWYLWSTLRWKRWTDGTWLNGSSWTSLTAVDMGGRSVS